MHTDKYESMENTGVQPECYIGLQRNGQKFNKNYFQVKKTAIVLVKRNSDETAEEINM